MPLAMGYNWLDCGQGEYLVLTPNHDQYHVNLPAQTCSCPRFGFGQRPCKHIEYVTEQLQPKPARARRQVNRPSIKVSVGGKTVEDRAAFLERMEREKLIDFD